MSSFFDLLQAMTGGALMMMGISSVMLTIDYLTGERNWGSAVYSATVSACLLFSAWRLIP